MPTTEKNPRAAVRQTLLVNIAFKGAFDFSGDTAWEEVTCVGYNPTQRQLTAVVSIKQTTGYSGGLCDAGSSEFVRFFVDWGAGLVDVGVTSFGVHDIPDVAPNPPHPIQYMVSLTLDDATHRKLCLKSGFAACPRHSVVEHAPFAQSERHADLRQCEGRAYPNRA